VPLLEHATRQDIKRLLDSFPVSTLKNGWPSVKGTKEEICFAAADEHDLPKIVKFMETNFGRCKLHVYVFRIPESGADPFASIPDAQVLGGDEDRGTLAMTTAVFSIFLKDPLEEITVEFLWPIRLRKMDNFLVLSFIVLERNPCVYFDRDCYKSARSIDERGIVKNLESLGYQRADLQKGVKTLWQENFMDSFQAKFKKPKSVATEEMDEELGIKENNPELYAQLQVSTLFTTLFQVSAESKCSVEVFQVDPSVGYIAFPRYTEGAGDSDGLVYKILENNI
jgi:hypothetical protein